MIEIGRLDAADRDRWAELWRQYLAFYRTELPPAQYDLTWSRLLADDTLHALAARAGGEIIGITHFLFHPSCWTSEPVCYLQDLFTAEAARGRGAARALIAAVADEARARRAPRLYWLTQADNETARALYDKVAKHTGFIRYEHAL